MMLTSIAIPDSCAQLLPAMWSCALSPQNLSIFIERLTAETNAIPMNVHSVWRMARNAAQVVSRSAAVCIALVGAAVTLGGDAGNRAALDKAMGLNEVNGDREIAFEPGMTAIVLPTRFDAPLTLANSVLPVKFGGSPTDMGNKFPLPNGAHTEVTAWWKRLMRDLERTVPKQ
jgi:hypothetical protein